MNQNEPMDKAAKEPEEVRKAKEKAMRLLLQQDGEGIKRPFVPCRLFGNSIRSSDAVCVRLWLSG